MKMNPIYIHPSLKKHKNKLYKPYCLPQNKGRGGLFALQKSQNARCPLFGHCYRNISICTCSGVGRPQNARTSTPETALRRCTSARRTHAHRKSWKEGTRRHLGGPGISNLHSCSFRPRTLLKKCIGITICSTATKI